MRRLSSSLAALALVPLLAAPALSQEKPKDVSGLAADLTQLYRDGDRDGADKLIAKHPEVIAFDEADSPVKVTARYVEKAGRPQQVQVDGGRALYFTFAGGGGTCELLVTRRGSAVAPLVVAVPPGAYAVPWTSDSQDVALLRAPVVVLAAGQASAKVEVPIACASFEKSGPSNGEGYTLHRFARDSGIDRLMVALCAGDEAPEQAAQLAIWVVRNGIDRAQLAEHEGTVTFGHHYPVHVGIGPDAARLIRSAGLNPDKLPFYDPAAQRAPAPAEDPEGMPMPQVPEGPVDPAANVS